MRTAAAILLAAAAVAPASAGAAPTPLVTCAAQGVPLIALARPDATQILLDPDGDARIERSTDQVGSQFVAAIASGNGLIVESDGRRLGFTWLCLLESDDRAVFFHWSRGAVTGPMEQCSREARISAEIAPCLQRLLEAAERELALAMRRTAQEADAPDAPDGRGQAGIFDSAWRAYRDAECARRREAAAGTGSAGDLLLDCLVRKTRQRARELNEY